MQFSFIEKLQGKATEEEEGNCGISFFLKNQLSASIVFPLPVQKLSIPPVVEAFAIHLVIGAWRQHWTNNISRAVLIAHSTVIGRMVLIVVDHVNQWAVLLHSLNKVQPVIAIQRFQAVRLLSAVFLPPHRLMCLIDFGQVEHIRGVIQ